MAAAARTERFIRPTGAVKTRCYTHVERNNRGRRTATPSDPSHRHRLVRFSPDDRFSDDIFSGPDDGGLRGQSKIV